MVISVDADDDIYSSAVIELIMPKDQRSKKCKAINCYSIITHKNHCNNHYVYD